MQIDLGQSIQDPKLDLCDSDVADRHSACMQFHGITVDNVSNAAQKYLELYKATPAHSLGDEFASVLAVQILNSVTGRFGLKSQWVRYLKYIYTALL